MGGFPIVSLDRIYLNTDEENIYFLDCTRLDGSNDLVTRNNPLDKKDVDKQIKILSMIFRSKNINEIVIADDVVFSGTVLRSVINKFLEYGIKVKGICSSISTMNSYLYFNSVLEYGLTCGYLMEEEVIDQICERDFYLGIAQSGISILKEGNVYKAPYFTPFGNPIERASIPSEYERYFSNGCIDRSIYLWETIEKLSNREIYGYDLPEQILNVKQSDSVVYTLKKGRR